MIINSNILSKFIDVPENLVELTNKYIIEVDEVKALHTATHLVIGHVLTCENHPDSDHLHVTTVDVGTEVLQIVCGAPNVDKGQFVIVAKVGAVLPGDFKIKDAKIRGVESFGMICSLKELGFDDKYIPEKYKEGIYNFSETVKPGTDALEVLGLKGLLVTLGLTPNRGDLLSHYGYALDLAAILKKEVKKINFTNKEITTKNPVKVSIDSNSCLRYEARVLDVVIKESPWWLKSALIAAGIRPINNVVDITNYVLIEYGTPLHAFDRTKVATDTILVRNANENEEVITLDEEKRILTQDDLVITNGKEVIAIAGVMGLLNTTVDESTKTIILEAASFSEKSVQKTVKRLNLRSESSLRFERGVDENRVRLGLERATELLIELADAKVYEGIVSSIGHQREQKVVHLTQSYISKRLGQTFKLEQIKDILERLGSQVKETKNGLEVKAPSHRLDLSIEADFLEEVGRIYGLDDIKNKPLQVKQVGALTHKQKLTRALRNKLSNLGLNETINYSLVSDNDLEVYETYGQRVSVLKPMSDMHKHMRQSLLGGLIDAASYNANRGLKDIFIFELGSVYAQSSEKIHLSVLTTGTFINSNYLNKNLNSDLNFLKGILQSVSETLSVNLTLTQSKKEYLHPGLSADIIFDQKNIGQFGKLHPTLAEKKGLKDVFVFELDLSDILSLEPKTHIYESISKYPSITRDVSFVVDKTYPVSDIETLIYQTARKLITNVDLIDVYAGSNIKEGMHSLAFRMTFNDKEKTLESNDVDKAMKSIKNRLQFTFKAEIRD